MYREYRDLTIAGAVTQCCECIWAASFDACHLLCVCVCVRARACLDRDMAARHRARASSIQIIKVHVVPVRKCRRPHVKQFHVSNALMCYSLVMTVEATPTFLLTHAFCVAELEDSLSPTSPSTSWPLQESICPKEAKHIPLMAMSYGHVFRFVTVNFINKKKELNVPVLFFRPLY